MVYTPINEIKHLPIEIENLILEYSYYTSYNYLLKLSKNTDWGKLSKYKFYNLVLLILQMMMQPTLYQDLLYKMDRDHILIIIMVLEFNI